MNGLLKAENFPVLLTLLIGLVGYQFNQLSERVIKAPTIEYDFKTISESDASGGKIKRELLCYVTNISSDKSFKDLIINFKFKVEDAVMFKPDVIIVHPSPLHGVEANTDTDSLLIEYKIKHFQPSTSYRMTFYTISDKADDAYPYLHITSDETVIALESSLTTWIVKNYFSLNLCAIGIWLTLIIIYILNYNRKQS